MKKLIILISLLITLIFVTACTDSADEEEIDVVKFLDPGNDIVLVQNYITQKIIEEGFGLETEDVSASTMSGFQGLRQGDIHVALEIWTENQREVYDEAIESGDIIDMGVNYQDKGQGFFVPTYVIEGDPERGIEPMAPDLKTAEDIKDYPELFEDPEDLGRGEIINSPSGWTMQEVMSEKIVTYGLDETMNDVLPGSGAALDASIVSAYEKGEPWVGYYWAPTWITAKYDMTLLEEPEYDEEIWDKNKGTAYPLNDVSIAVFKELPEQHPEITEMLENYSIDVELIEEVMIYMQDNDTSPEEAGTWWMEKYEDIWTSWVSEDIAEKVKEGM